MIKIILGIVHSEKVLRGQGGEPWVQIIGNELECLVARGGHGCHFAGQEYPHISCLSRSKFVARLAREQYNSRVI